MIRRVDLPVNSAQFSVDYNGQQPYNSKYSIPVSRIYYSNTPFTVRSLGLTATWVNRAEQTVWRSTSFTGTIPGGIVKFWWDYGYPAEITNPSDKNYWGLQLKGYFRPEFNGDYKFYFAGGGEINDLNVNGVSRASNLKLKPSQTTYQESSTITLSSASWVSFTLKYKTTIAQNMQTGLVCLYRRINDSTVMPERVVLSAGVTAPDGTAPTSIYPISQHTVGGYTDVTVDNDEFGAQSLKFTVPFVKNDGYSFRGYEKYGNGFHNLEDTSYNYVLNKFRMITYYEGYQNSAGAQEMVQKFTGHIKDFDIKYSADGNDTLQITCLSPINYVRTQFAEHCPNPSDYMAAGYLTEQTGHVDGIDKPRAYDGWELYKAFQNCLINAYIDPIYLYKRKEFSSHFGFNIAGDYLIDYTGKSEKLWLARQRNYGNLGNIKSANVKPDDEYVYTADAGEYYYDVINKLTEPYLIKWGFTRRGYPFMKAIDAPNVIKDDSQFSFVTGTWTQKTDDFDCVKATYRQATTRLALATVTGYFSRADLLLRVGTNTGSISPNNYINVSVRLSANFSVILESTTLNPYNSQTWSFYRGADQTTGQNPCVFNIASGLKYDSYQVWVQKATSSGFCNLDAVFMYDEDINHPSFNFKTGDTVSNGQVTGLDIYESAGEIRNTCVVLGKRTGTKTGYVDDFTESDLNPNNPIGTFYSSKVIDLNSISSPSAVNYSGVPLKTIIVEPNITSQDQADFIAFEFVKQNRTSHQELNFETIGNPMVEINDCVTISDDYKGGVTSSRKMWITNVQNGMSQGGYLTKFSAIDIKPNTSYYQKPQPDLANFGNTPIQNVRIYNAGVNGRTTQSISGTQSIASLTVNTSLQYAPPKGYIKVIKGVSESIMKYEYISSASGVWRYNTLTQGLQGTNVQAFATNATVIGAWDPYTQDGMNVVPVVTFDLLADSQVEVLIKGYQSQASLINVARLTNQFSNEFPYDGYNVMTWGTNKFFTWNGMDDFGYWNTYHVRNLPVGEKSGIFAGEPVNFSGIQEKFGTYIPEITVRYDGNTKTYPTLAQLPTSQRIYSRRGGVSSISFNIQYNNFYLLTNTQTETLYANNPYGIQSINRYCPYMKSDANYPDFLRYVLLDNSVDYTSDSDYFRSNRIYLEARMENYIGHYFEFALPYMDNGEIVNTMVVNTKRVLLDGKDYKYDIRNGGNGFTGSFNPEISVDDIEFKFLPPSDFIDSTRYVAQALMSAYGADKVWGGLYFFPVIFFTGFVVDKSGRRSVAPHLYSQVDVIANAYAESVGQLCQFMGWSYTPIVGSRKPFAKSSLYSPSASEIFSRKAVDKIYGEILKGVGFDRPTPYHMVMYLLVTGEF